jgi:predicted MFS family arabinose efflux permease
LTVISFNVLFAGTVIGFLCSALLVVSVQLPSPATATTVGQSFYDKTTRGIRIYLATPRLRGLLALNLSVAAAGSMVLVNTVVLVRGVLGRPDGDVAIALACFGGGSMFAALLLPYILDRLPDRSVMVSAAGLLTALLVILGITLRSTAPDLIWPLLLGLWVLAGIGYSAVQTPTGRLLRRSAQPSDRPAVFAAQFALSHGCWLLTYPLAGWLGETAGLSFTTLVLAAVTLAGVAGALLMWPTKDPEVIEHDHPDLSPDDSHLVDASRNRHAHAFVIDDLHTRWPNDA